MHTGKRSGWQGSTHLPGDLLQNQMCHPKGHSSTVSQPLPAHLNMTTRTSHVMIIFGKPIPKWLLQAKLFYHGEQLSLSCTKFTPPLGSLKSYA